MTASEEHPAYPNAATLFAASNALAAHLDTLTPDQVSSIYADGSTVDADDNMWTPCPDHWVEAGTEGRVFVDRTGAAASYSPSLGEWLPLNPGPDVLTDQGLALWGSEQWGYPVQ